MEKTELSVPIKHYPFDNAAQFINKMQHYSTLFAQNNKNKRSSSPLRAFSSALFAFFKSYFIKKGFLCGYEGLLISVSNANGVFYKYIKLFEENKK
ncbi:hypothetical protein [Sulfurimonas sp.]|uniref:hypothetical protein n=1 Tax=Sulfurimonas sp. TaxID=2022749 RepID=UPI0019FD64F3|nr:hypothetical protein [Sulfurimonas sp.]MBE0515690.1 hypothetical protein [Sulfurimonas sp.]